MSQPAQQGAIDPMAAALEKSLKELSARRADVEAAAQTLSLDDIGKNPIKIFKAGKALAPSVGPLLKAYDRHFVLLTAALIDMRKGGGHG